MCQNFEHIIKSTKIADGKLFTVKVKDYLRYTNIKYFPANIQLERIMAYPLFLAKSFQNHLSKTNSKDFIN